MKLSKFSAGLLIALMSGFVPATVAFADNVHEVIVAPNTDTIIEGGSTVVGYKISAVSGSNDTQQHCNAEDGSAATLTINVPSGVSVTSSTLTFTTCSNNNSTVQDVTFSSSVPGDYPITVSISDIGGGVYNTSTADFTLHVTAAVVVPPADTTAPILTLPANMTVEADSASGAVVSYSASAIDASPANPVVNCTPVSGSTFVLGLTTVNCSATDAASNTAEGSFTVTVVDTTAPETPTHTSPANNTFTTTANQTSIDWSDVTDVDDVSNPVSYVYQASNSADVTGTGEFVTPVYTSVPALTSSFIPTPGTPEGVYYWHVRAIDAANNAGAWSSAWKITVDNTAPVLSVPTAMNTEATGPDGAMVDFFPLVPFVSATDNYTASPLIVCTPASGTTFAVGTTTVSCTATDDAGNEDTGTFDVTVHDYTAPTGSVVINADAVYANTTSATLSLVAADVVGVTGYRIADGTDASAASTVEVASNVAFALPVAWTLPSGDGSKTVSVQYRDLAGNWSANVTDDITLDTTAPSITISAPTVTAYALNQVVTADYDCNDGSGSGVATCVGDVADGATLDTSVAGAKSFTVNSTDNAGNVSTKTVNYSVGYNPGTFVAGAPVTLTAKEFKSKSTIPVKFTIKDWLNNPYGLAAATLQICKVGGTCFLPTASGSSNIGSAFRYDVSGGQYIYNLSTKTPLTAGQYILKITIDGNLQTPSSTITIK
jgi:hypothetical protein